MIYFFLKFLHILGAGIWLGGLVTVTVLDMILLRTNQPDARDAIASVGQRIRQAIIAPSAGVTLLAGGLAVAVSGTGIVFWIAWGLAAIVVATALGATVVRRSLRDLVTLSRDAGRGDPRVGALGRRLAMLDAVLILLVVSTVWVMVFKPTL